MLKYASELIKSKKGNLTPAADKETLDGIKSEWFTETSRALLKGEYIFKTKLQGGAPAIESALRRNQIPLCRGNHLTWLDTEER